MTTGTSSRPARSAAKAASKTLMTPAERKAAGKAARTSVPRSSNAFLPTPTADRDPVALLESQAASRVPELVPVRYGRMLVSPFTFYRGAALIMAADLAKTPSSGFMVQLCGDAHLSNFGVFGSPERRLVFDINDFDETHPGPWEWDVKRLVASVEIAGRNRHFTVAQRRASVLATAARYRTAMAEFAAMGNVDVWHASLDADQLLALASTQLSRAAMRKTKAVLAKSLTRDSMTAQSKLTTLVDGERRIISDPPLIVPIEEAVPDLGDATALVTEIRRLLQDYQKTLPVGQQRILSEFEYIHLARKVVGVGSVGTRAWIVLMRGRDDSDPLLLQVKEAMPSVLAEFTPSTGHTHQGERVVEGQRQMQASSDIFLGWVQVKGVDGVERDFYVRQLKDWKGSVDTETMIPNGMKAYGEVCAWALAHAHARTGDRIAIAAYLGNGTSFDEAIAEFAIAYADQNERDYEAFAEAVADGRLTAVEGI